MGEGGEKDPGLWLRGQEQRKETSRPHPFKEPLEQRLPGPRGVGLAQPPPPARRPEPAHPAHPRPARARGAGERSALAAPARRRLPGSRRRPGAEGWGAAGDAEGLAAPTFSLFSSEVTARGGAADKRADTVPRDRETSSGRAPGPTPTALRRAAPRPLPQRAPHLRRARLRRRRRRLRGRQGPAARAA